MTTNLPEQQWQQEITNKPSTIKYAQSINEHKTNAWFIGLQGFPGTGKTYSALTFPNPIVMDYDNKLGLHLQRKDILRIPFWNNDYVIKEFKTTYKVDSKKASVRDATLKFLRDNIKTLTAEHTLIFDSWSMFQDMLDVQHHDEPVINRQNEIDMYKFWGRKLEYSVRTLTALKALSCNVIVTCHETPERDKDGDITTILKPLMDGSFKDKFAGAFPNFWRQRVIENKETKQLEYFWQIKSDRTFNAITSHEFQGNPPMIRADYAELVKTTQTPNT